MTLPFSSIRFCAFESRRGDELKRLIEKLGGQVQIAPSLREIPLSSNREALQFGEELVKNQIDIVLLLTGVGVRALWEILEGTFSRTDLDQHLLETTIVVRGPKPAAVLREWGLRIDHQIPEPNTWREILSYFDQNLVVSDRVVAVQEYGNPNPELYSGLRDRGARVLPVPVYRWGFPDDLMPLRSAIKGMVAGELDGLIFTSAQQIQNVLAIADEQGLKSEFLKSCHKTLIASVGPTASEALRNAGIEVDLEPEHPKMGHLAVALAEDSVRLLNRKRNQ